METNGSTPTPATSKASARKAGLHYVSDIVPGIRRIGSGKRFRYLTPTGKPLRNHADLARIKGLAIPPAWQEVWICPSRRGHIQAVGRDARGRKQYIYHLRWREVRDENKYGQLATFAKLLPSIRRRVTKDLARSGLPRERVLATVVRLLESTLVRIGNDEYARDNGSFGLTTMRNRHVQIQGHDLHFKFKGKSGQPHSIRLTDRRLAKIVKACQDIPGYDLFQYLDDEGRSQGVDSSDVNAYLREISGAEVTAKLFRTWAATVEALKRVRAPVPEGQATSERKKIAHVVKEVAVQLGNTPAVCRKSYIHPAALECFDRPERRATLERFANRKGRARSGLSTDERLTLAFLEDWQRKQARAPTLEQALKRSLVSLPKTRRRNQVA